VELLALTLKEAHPDNLATKTKDNPTLFNQIFGLAKPLENAGLNLVIKRGVLTKMNLTEGTDSFFFRCPRLLSEP